jgi:HK97 family phage prohead protease
MAASEDQPAVETTETRDPTPEMESRRAFAESMKGSREQREFTVSDMECRSLDDGTLRMSGYASLTEDPYEIGGGERGFIETIKRGAFRRTLAEGPDTVLLINHGGIPLAGTRNGSLALSEDAKGLRWTADLDAEDPDSQMLSRKVANGLMDQCSFAFVCTDDEWSDDYRQRSIKSVSLHRGDVSVVTHGANANTTVGIRSMVDDLVESRSGKSLSAKNRKELQDLQDAVGAILDGNDASEAEEDVVESKDAPDTPEVEPELEQSPVDPVSDDLMKTGEALLVGARAADDPAERGTVYMPDYTTRARQRLTVLQRRVRS